MSDNLVPKTIRIPSELAASLEAEAKAAGESFSKYAGRILEDLAREKPVAKEASDSRIGALADALLKQKNHPEFGDETAVQELLRRTMHVQLLIMQMVTASFEEEDAEAMLDQTHESLLKALMPS